MARVPMDLIAVNDSRVFKRGFSLIEVLVALLVLSLALLGLGVTQVLTLKQNSASMLRSQAVQYAYDMADRIRANGDAGTAYSLGLANRPPASARDCVTEVDNSAINCTAAEMAAFDLAQWYCSMEGGVGAACNTRSFTGWDSIGIQQKDALPGVQGGIAWDATTERYTITIRWLEDNSFDDSNESRFGTVVLEVDPWRP